LVRGLGIALAMPALFVVASRAQSVNTTTALTEQTTQTSGSAPCSLTSVMVAVTANTGVPADSVSIQDEVGSTSVQLASALLDSAGQASFVLALANGPHSLSAVYAGDATFNGSSSTPASVTISSQCDSQFVVTASNLTPSSSAANTLALTPGQTGTATITVVPLQPYVPSLTGPPTFITISCSGLPDLANCNFTPENVEIAPGQAAGVTSTMVIQTYAANTTSLSPPSLPGKGSSPIAWAFLLPGALGLGGFAWGARRRLWLKRISLVALLGLITLLGTTACNPRYGYENHGPLPNPPTPAGSYTVKIAAQSSNGVTAVTNSASFTLTVK
jgi:hypothetical protein